MGEPFRAMMEADLGRLFEALSKGYQPGTLERLGRVAPGLNAAIQETEASLGPLYQELLAADATLARWREGLAELERLWRLAIQVAEPAQAEAPDSGELDDEPVLAEVA